MYILLHVVSYLSLTIFIVKLQITIRTHHLIATSVILAIHIYHQHYRKYTITFLSSNRPIFFSLFVRARTREFFNWHFQYCDLRWNFVLVYGHSKYKIFETDRMSVMRCKSCTAAEKRIPTKIIIVQPTLLFAHYRKFYKFCANSTCLQLHGIAKFLDLGNIVYT